MLVKWGNVHTVHVFGGWIRADIRSQSQWALRSKCARQTQELISDLFPGELEFDCRKLNCEAHICCSYLEIGRHEGVVYNHHYVLVVFVDQLRAGLNVNNLHRGVGGRLDPHQLHRERTDVISSSHKGQSTYVTLHFGKCFEAAHLLVLLTRRPQQSLHKVLIHTQRHRFVQMTQ